MDEARRDAFAERMLGQAIGALEVLGVYLGVRLGLYRALADGDAHNPGDLSGAAGVHPRYAREWLEEQAVAGILTADDSDDPDTRRFTLPPEHADVLVNELGPAYLAPASLLVTGIAGVLPRLVDAYRTGTGISFGEYGADVRDGQAAFNRPMFVGDLGGEWIPAMPDVHERLRADPPARVADVGCGAGWSTIGLKQAYPKIEAHGIDLDGASIADARRNAKEAGLDGAVSFEVCDAADPALAGRYDLVCILEALHDMSRPVEALAVARALLADGGSVLVVDERVADAFTAPGDEVERMMYGWSILHCLPVGLAEQPSAATGTVMRADTVRRYAADAGLSQVEVLPVENDFFRLYRLRP
ncbi:MAG: class I SAM-dependent methyltransferase [Actinobacteria bacterium]|nr:class I SAM-dependent methyltransferase [Actinomycetota bacterium]